MKRLKNKLKSYYQQDKINGRLHYVYFHGLEHYIEQNITLNELLEMIKRDGLICYLCNLQVKICCKSYSGKQLTLDRINNNRNHAADNVRICCYVCNTMRSNNYSSNEFKKTFF
jgi:hypothetical protein